MSIKIIYFIKDGSYEYNGTWNGHPVYKKEYESQSGRPWGLY